jgi:hypothetical protein
MGALAQVHRAIPAWEIAPSERHRTFSGLASSTAVSAGVGEVEAVDWLEAWRGTVAEAMEALHARAARCVAEKSQPEEDA